LIGAFLLVAILPAVPLSLVVRNLLQRGFSPALDASIEQALDAGLGASRDRFLERKHAFELRVRGEWSERVAGGQDAHLTDTGHGAPALVWLGPPPGALGMPETGDPPAAHGSPGAAEPELATSLQRWYRDEAALDPPANPGQADPGAVLAGPARVGSALVMALVGADSQPVLLVEPLPPAMVERARSMTDGLGLLRVLHEERPAVLRSYVVPFLLVYAILILVAVAVGVVLARRIARPVEALVASTQQVADGDLEARVHGSFPGEIGELVTAFNRMVGRLSEQRRELGRLERVAAWRDLSRTLAHEIKNPLTPILLAVQQTKDDYQGDDQQYRETLDECTDIVREEVEGLRALVAEFSEFARLPKPRPTRGDLRPLLDDLQRLYGEQRVALDVPAPALTADLDVPQMRRALVNLIDNALAATAARSATDTQQFAVHISCRATEHGGWLLTIRDDGVGISPEHLTRIFEPNFSTKQEGMGLGLPVVDSVIRGHGGTITVESELGRGTEFRIRLPRPAPEEGRA